MDYKAIPSSSQMSGGHKHRYKNVGLSADELRRRREEEGVQLRKQKREQQLFKRRNVNLPAPDAPDIAVPVITALSLVEETVVGKGWLLLISF